MLQHEMIARLREAGHGDERVAGALLYGSFTTREGDAFSGIDFAYEQREVAFENFDQRAWIDAVSPSAAYSPKPVTARRAPRRRVGRALVNLCDYNF